MNRRTAFWMAGMCLLAGLEASGQTTVTLTASGAVWKYLDTGSDQGTAWRQPAFNDSTWASGPAQLGYGDGDEATVVAGGPSGARFTTTYFRRAFVAPPGLSFANLTARVVRDDGAVVYLNGIEVFRNNMPGGDITYNTFASSVVGGGAEGQFFPGTFASAPLVTGTNVIAVEIHQSDPTSSDISFNLELSGLTTTTVTPPLITSNPAPSTVSEGSAAQFNAAATGTGPLAYRWFKEDAPLVNGVRFAGVTTPGLVIRDTVPADMGGYSVVVSNASGTATSRVAQLTVTALPTEIFDDFEPGIDLAQWAAFGGTARATNYGGNVSPPNALCFGGDGDRFALTRPMNTSLGGVISFNIRIASGFGGDPNWEMADIPDEGVVFEYSVDNGATWFRIATYDTPVYTEWTLQQFFIPSGAVAPRTQFRWRQFSNSGSCCDHWALDDVDVLSDQLPPIILTQPADQVALSGGEATFAVNAGGMEPLLYQWTFNGMEIPGAIGPVLALHSLTTNQAGLYQLQMHNSIGDLSSREARLTVVDVSGDVFRITSLGTNDSAVVEHSALSGPARGGFAASSSRLFVTGEEGTTSLDLADLGQATNLAATNDAIVSDLRSGKVYVLASPTAPLSINGGIVTRLIEMDPVTGQLTANVTPLTTPVIVSGNYYGAIGFFSGVGRVGVFNGTNAYSIFVPSGLVIDHGRQPAFPSAYVGNWAYWGVLEYFDGATWLTRLADLRTIVRTRVSDSYTETVAAFTFLGNMGGITVSPARNRWYFHFEGFSEFGTGDEVSGFAGATFSFQQGTQAVSIVGQPRGRKVVAGTSVDFQVSAVGYPLEFQWFREGMPLPGETGFRLHLNSVKPSDAGVYSVVVGNVLGSVTSSGAVLRVVAPATVAVYDDPNYVDTYGGPYADSDAVQASLSALGHNVSTFTNLVSALVPGHVVLFPTLLYGNPAGSLDATTRAAVRDFVLNGGLIVFVGGGYAAAFANDIWGLSWLVDYPGGGLSLLTTQAIGTAFADAPPQLPANSSTYGLASNSLPSGARIIYQSGGISTVSRSSLGSGRLIHLGWSFENAVPLGSQDGGWLEVLSDALQETAPPDPGPPGIAVQPEDRPTVVGIDASLNVVPYGPGPITFQWFREGSPLPGETNVTLRVPAPSVSASANFAVVVSNPFGSVTSRTAHVTVRVSRGLAGLYLDYFAYAGAYPGPELAVLQAGFTPVRITNIATFNFSPLSFLLLDASYAGSVSPELQARLPAITAWVMGGGRVIVHDITGYSSGVEGTTTPMVLGAGNTLVAQAYLSEVNLSPPGGTLITDGPYGALTDSSLDHVGLVTLTALVRPTLSAGMIPILESDNSPTQVVAVSYGLGSGVVFYSTIYLNYLLQSSAPITPVLRTVYLPNAIEHVLAFTPSGPPLLVQYPQETSALLRGTATMNVIASGLPALRYQWRFNDADIAGATNTTLTLTNVTAASAGFYSVLVSNPLGSTSSPPARLSIIDAKPFRIVSLGANESRVVDHNALTDDDRGGIAVSRNSVFVTGDARTARFAAADLSGGTPLPEQYDALLSNLRTETVYTLANGTNIITYGGGIVDALIEIDGNTGALTTNVLRLSSPVPMQPSDQGGIYSGYDAAVLHDGNRAYRIDFVTGLVSDLGQMNPPQHQRAESWAHWGLAEYFNGAMWLVAVRDPQTITRTRVPDGFTTTVSTFNNLGETASISMSPSRDRWYFHYEGSAQFGGSAETLGYAIASWDKPPQISGFGGLSLNEDASMAGVPLNVFDDQTPAASLVLTASSSDTNLLPNASLVFSGAGSFRTLAINPVPNRYGTSVLTLTLTDAIGNTTTQSAPVVVVPVNDAPGFSAGTNVTVMEDSGSTVVVGWATQISPGPFEEGQSVTFVVSNDNPALFASAPALTAAGDLSFAPAPNASGSATVTVRLVDNGGTANGGLDTSASQTFTLAVLPVNDPPAAFAQSVTTAEDTPVNMTLAGADIEGTPLTYVIVSPPAHGALGGTGANLVYTPALNYNGPDGFTFQVNDGLAASAPAAVSLLITPVNDAPVAQSQSLTNQEDQGLLITLSGSDVDGDPLRYDILSAPTNGTLTRVIPKGALFNYKPNPDFFGTDVFTFRVSDASTSSAPASVVIRIQPVNDPPQFSAGPDITVAEDSGSQTFPAWATGISPGPNEATQTVHFELLVDALSLFAAGPALSPGGTLTFTPAANAHGTAVVKVQLSDDGPAAEGGPASSPLLSFRIHVTPVNDPPVAEPASLTLQEDPPGGSAFFLLRAADPDGDAVSFLIVTPPAHGTVVPAAAPTTTIDPLGVAHTLAPFRYAPAPDYSGPDSFTCKVNDGQADSATVSVTITVQPVNDPPVAVPRVLNLLQLLPGTGDGIILSRNNTNGSAILDASLSHDFEGDPMIFAWYRDDELTPFAIGVTTTNLFAIGNHLVLLVADDGHDSGSATVRFNVVSPAMALEELIQQVSLSGLPRQRIRPLEASLKAAMASFDRGNFIAAANQLKAFQNKLRAQVAPSYPALAASLDAAVQTLLDTLQLR